MKAIRIFLLALLSVAGNVPSDRMDMAHARDKPFSDVLPRVVKIFGAGGMRNLHAYSSGFLISPEGHIATVWSHVLDADRVTVVLDDGRRFTASVLNAEPQLDLAILKLDTDLDDFPFFEIDGGSSVGPGTRVYAFSNVFRVATGDEPVSIMHAIVAAKTNLTARRGAFDIPYQGAVYILDSVTNSSGASGGVLTSRDGLLLGMIGREVRDARSNTWLNYAVPIDELRETMHAIIDGDYTARGRSEDDRYAAPRYRPVDFGLILIPAVVARTPAWIDDVIADSVADEAGLLRNDLIVFVGEDIVQSCDQLKRAIGQLQPGAQLRLVVRRDATLITVNMPVR